MADRSSKREVPNDQLGGALRSITSLRSVRIFAGVCFLLILASSGFVAWVWFQFPDLSGENFEFLVGEDARDRMSKQLTGAQKLVSVNADNATDDCFVFEGGSFNGTILYWMCECRSVDDCWRLAEAWSGRKQSEFEPWQPSEFSCVMQGPGFYKEKRAASLWNVAEVKNGMRFYSVYKDKSLEMFAIDFDRRRVYGAYESGGIPKEKWHPAPASGGS